MLSLQEFSNGCISVSGIQKYPTRFENENRIMEELFSKADWASFGNEHQISTNKVEKNEFGQFCIWRESKIKVLLRCTYKKLIFFILALLN